MITETFHPSCEGCVHLRVGEILVGDSLSGGWEESWECSKGLANPYGECHDHRTEEQEEEEARWGADDDAW